MIDIILLFNSMREIFKNKKGKDFYRDTLEYFEYDPDMPYEKMHEYDIYYMDDDEISYYIEKKIDYVSLYLYTKHRAKKN